MTKSFGRSGPMALIAFVCLAYGISWLVWAPLWLPSFGVTGLPVLPFQHALGALGPALSALIVTGLFGGRGAVVELLRKIVFLGKRPWLLAVALLSPFVLLAAGLTVACVLNGSWTEFSAIGTSTEFPTYPALAFLAYNILSFGIGEETGWRGFALPHLQARYSALVSTVILTAIWACWHLPLFAYRPGYVNMDIGGIAGWLVSLATGAILLTSLFNASRGSILVVAVFHAAIDVAFTSAGLSPIAVNLSGALVTLTGIAIVARFGASNLSPDGRVVWLGGHFVWRPRDGAEEHSPGPRPRPARG